MYRLILLILLVCLVPLAAPAHPGKTDKYGGHKCLKGCEEWKLDYAEYHLHDKDGRPIHVAKRKHTVEPPEPAAVNSPPAVTSLPVTTSPIIETRTVYRVVNIYEENQFLSNPLIYVLLFLLLLLLILRTKREKETRK